MLATSTMKVSICKFLMLYGECKHLETCVYAHPTDMDAAKAEYLVKQNFKLCPAWQAGACARPGCTFIHTAVTMPATPNPAAAAKPAAATKPANANPAAARPANARPAAARPTQYNRTAGARPVRNTVATPLQQKLAALNGLLNRLTPIHASADEYNRKLGGKSNDAKHTIESIEQLIKSTLVTVEGSIAQFTELSAALGAPAEEVGADGGSGDGGSVGGESAEGESGGEFVEGEVTTVHA